MSLLESRPTRLDPQQVLELEKRKQLFDHCLELIEQPVFREQILSEIARALQSNECEIHVSLPVEQIQEPQFRELILSEISQALQFTRCENHASLPMVDKPSEPQTMFSYFDVIYPIHLIIENGQSYTLRLMFMKAGVAKIEYDLMILGC